MGYKRKGDSLREKWKRSIANYFSMAFNEARENPERARRYVLLAKRTAQKTNIRINPELNRRYCKRCLIPLLPGVTARVRIHNSRIVLTCLSCGSVRRFPLKNNGKTDKIRKGR